MSIAVGATKSFSHDSNLTGVPGWILAWLYNVAMFDKVLQENLDGNKKWLSFTLKVHFVKFYNHAII